MKQCYFCSEQLNSNYCKLCLVTHYCLDDNNKIIGFSINIYKNIHLFSIFYINKKILDIMKDNQTRDLLISIKNCEISDLSLLKKIVNKYVRNMAFI